MTIRIPHLDEIPDGAAGARRLAAEFLAEMMPLYLVEARRVWDLLEKELPDPEEVLPHPAVTFEASPLIAVSNVNDGVGKIVDQDGDRTEYDTTYSLRIFSWVKTTEQIPTYDLRDRYAAIIRAAFLDSTTLNGRPCRVEKGTISASYGELQKVNGDRFVAGSFVNVGLTVHEALVRSSGATVATVMVDGQAVIPEPMLSVPIHPAFD